MSMDEAPTRLARGNLGCQGPESLGHLSQASPFHMFVICGLYRENLGSEYQESTHV